MENKKGTVTHLSSAGLAAKAAAATSPQQTMNEEERKQRKLAFTRALVHGIARLIEGQRQFADEFGLSLRRVFPHSYELLEGQTPTQLAISLFTADWKSISELENMFADLIQHQVSLFSALDGIAHAALKQMGDEGLGDGRSKLNDARAWRLHKERLQELIDNDSLRFEKLVASGFVRHYIKSHENPGKKSEKGAQNIPGGRVA
jgi:superfamily I DNA/RNA helicase